MHSYHLDTIHRYVKTILVGIILFGLFASRWSFADNIENYQWSGPFVKENLTIFLAHGKDQTSLNSILTLAEAMDKKLIKVHETGDVNQLAIENLSTDHDVYIQSGDIVKGGKQDRALSTDMLLPPKSGKIEISSFCVESGRWQARKNESVHSFSSSKNQLVSKDLKLAAKLNHNQGEVWEKVDEAQAKMARATGESVKDQASQSSLQLSLENKKLQQKTTQWYKSLVTLVDAQPDVIGYAFSINGKFNNADIYGSNTLLKKMWPKLLMATITETISEQQTANADIEKLDIASLQQWLQLKHTRKPASKTVSNSTIVDTYENDSQAVFETKDTRYQNVMIHRNYLAK